jgi:TolA-binding protein
MENIEEQILSYPDLSVEKKREVETYVEAHPEWASLLQDVRAIEALIPDVETERASDGLLTTYVVVRHLHPDAASAELKEAFRRFEQTVDENPELQERVEAARQRLENAEAAVDPVAQFEELTGHSLDPKNGDATASASTTATTRETAAPSQSDGSSRSLVDTLLRLPLAVRWAGAAVAVLVAAYGVLFAASEASQSTLDRLAAVDVSKQVVDNYASTTTRSPGSSADTLTAGQLYVDALTAVQEARSSTLGLFPTYDSEALDRAERLLKQVLDQTESGSFIALEARFYLGKVNLARDQVEPARSNFKIVVEREGRMAAEARSILKTLESEYSAGENAGQ